jgi:nucleoside-diphosphate-sugar epimerase
VVLNNLVAWAVTTGRVHLKSDGTPWRPLVHVEDISRAFLAVLEAPRSLVHAQAFNVGSSDENYRVSELAKIVAETVPGTTVEFAEGASPDKRNYRVACDRITNVLGFRTNWTVRRGAAELYEGYRNARLTLADFEGPRYQRIAHINALLATGDLGSDLRWRTSVAATH